MTFELSGLKTSPAESKAGDVDGSFNPGICSFDMRSASHHQWKMVAPFFFTPATKIKMNSHTQTPNTLTFNLVGFKPKPPQQAAHDPMQLGGTSAQSCKLARGCRIFNHGSRHMQNLATAALVSFKVLRQ